MHACAEQYEHGILPHQKLKLNKMIPVNFRGRIVEWDSKVDREIQILFCPRWSISSKFLLLIGSPVFR
jgi:hypothetical protein